MESVEIFLSILSVIIGYFLGSVLPAFLFGKLKGIDIREEGTKNAGTANAYRILGLSYAIPTALYDTLKGLLAMLIAYSLGVNFIFWQLSGIAAIIGHIFPFYIKFRGGQGVATATGLLLFYLVNYISANLGIFFVLLYLIILIVIFVYVCNVGSLLSLITFPILGFAVFQIYPNSPFNVFFVLVLIHIASIGLYKIISEKKIIIEDESFKASWWRVAIRPMAILFVLFYVFNSKMETLTLIGGVALVFIFIDLLRFIHKQTNILLTEKLRTIFRKSEISKFSSMTLFLIGSFFSILLFEKLIAQSVLIFLIFGDIFGKIFGLAFGKHKIFDKTFEGTLAFAGGILICGYFIFNIFHIHLLVLLCGGVIAPIAELFSLRIDDNFTVPMVSGAVMTVVALFLGI